MIVTLSEAKTLLQITSSTKDTYITALLPTVQDFIINYTHNDFINENIYITAQTLSFDSTAKTISDSASGFTTAGFLDGFDIKIEGSKHNDGYYTLTTATANTLTISTSELVTNESAGEEITIYKVVFPKGLKTVAASFIGYNLATIKDQIVQSESIGGYSVTYQATGEYPKSLLSNLKQYTKIRFT